MTVEKKQLLLISENQPLLNEIRTKLERKEIEDGHFVIHLIENEQQFSNNISTRMDCVVTDYSLSWTDGLVILRTIKNIDPYCPVIILTQLKDETTVLRAMKEDLDDYILLNEFSIKKLCLIVETTIKKTDIKRRASFFETQYKTLFNSIPVGLYRSTMEGDIIMVNSSLAKSFGYTSLNDFKGTNALNLYCNQKEREKWKEELLKNNEVHFFNVQYKKKNGGTFWGEEFSRVIFNEKGEPFYVDGCIVDKTPKLEKDEKKE